ncbi:hypothetical protein KC345_g292 [Hortaea werneckii]|nr:hypothetical protein KC345_g292 [Hortaea werneckii]
MLHPPGIVTGLPPSVIPCGLPSGVLLGIPTTAEELRHVLFVVPFGDGLVAEDLVEVLLQASLRGGMYREEEQGEVDGVGGCLVTGEDEDKSVSKDFVVRQELSVRRAGAGFLGVGVGVVESFCSDASTFDQSAH